MITELLDKHLPSPRCSLIYKAECIRTPIVDIVLPATSPSNHAMRLMFIISLLQTIHGAMAFSLNPYNLYDGFFIDQVRNTLSMFHINLSHGRYAANAPMVSLDIEWNRNGGLLLGRNNFVTTLAEFNTTFHGLQVPDRYHIVDGNVGAVLYRLQGPQTGEFAGIANTGKLLDIWGSELMQFNSEAKLSYLISIEEFGIAVEQLTGQQPVTSPVQVNLLENPQTSPEFRQTLRNHMASLHQNFNERQQKAISAIVARDVAVDADQTLASGVNAFLELFNSGLESFPDKIFHDDFILADGHLGAIESVWEGTQKGAYTTSNGTVITPTGQAVRVRSILFLEFNDEALIVSATLVHDEGVIERQLLEKQTATAYPLYP